MGIRIDLGDIKKRAGTNSGVYQSLKKKILSIPTEKFDALLHPLVSEITSKVDCTECGNCCRQLNPPVREDEVAGLAEKRNQSEIEFSTAFLHRNEKDPYYFFNHKPCIFLAGNLCTIYENRPDSCKDYPHLHSPGQKFRFGRTIEQAEVCPIVFHVLEELQKKLE